MPAGRAGRGGRERVPRRGQRCDVANEKSSRRHSARKMSARRPPSISERVQPSRGQRSGAVPVGGVGGRVAVDIAVVSGVSLKLCLGERRGAGGGAGRRRDPVRGVRVARVLHQVAVHPLSGVGAAPVCIIQPCSVCSRSSRRFDSRRSGLCLHGLRLVNRGFRLRVGVKRQERRVRIVPRQGQGRAHFYEGCGSRGGGVGEGEG
mmetsp:Transcript_48553/g.123137  ORF Transcript_48553/g.123137 Transcript_48553/m.123137 type:complete len:205 (+) Transcript_48553:369-983(+)